MKRFVVALLLSLPLLLSAQHLKFMGIPLDGTITAFQAKLTAKGITYDAQASKALSGPVRLFHGLFFNQKADIFVYYNAKSKWVYRAKACIYCTSRSNVENTYYDLLLGLKAKYPDATVNYGDQDGFDCASLYIGSDRYIGRINLYVAEELYDTGYVLHVDYIDNTNDLSNDRSKMDDL